MSFADFNDLYIYVNNIVEIEPSEFQFFIEHSGAKIQSYRKGEHFCRQGDQDLKLAYVKTGIFKVYMSSSDGRHFTKRFVASDELLGPYSSVIMAESSTVNICALKNSEIIEWDALKARDLIKRNHRWGELARIIAENYFSERERREYEAIMLTGEEKYNSFVKKYAHIIDEVSQKEIAGYLGLSPVSLSRIRNKK